MKVQPEGPVTMPAETPPADRPPTDRPNDDAYRNAAYIPGGADYAPRWAACAAAFRDALGPRAELGQPYGSGERNWFDLFHPEAPPRGLLIFVHGGYWHLFGPRDFSHLAAGALALGWAVAMPAYTLAPAARIPAMTREIATAIDTIADRIPGTILLTGHSAGGHLAARMACDGVLPDTVAARLGVVMPISPLSDLAPLRLTTMNDTLRIDASAALEESPAFLLNREGLPVHVWVGGAERPAFLDQARWLAEAWGVPLTVEKGRHHFDVIEGLERADSPLMRALMGEG
jgi:acetyl esterase/lipase